MSNISSSFRFQRKAPNDVRAHSHEFDPVDAKTRAIAQGIIDEVRSGGETALRSIATKFGDLASPDARLVLDREAMKIAYDEIPKDQQMLLERVAARIRVFAEAQRAALTNIDVTVPGGRAGHTVSPCATAGCYAPGGRYPLPSSVLMTAITARVAGVETVWVASPRPLPITIASAYVSGADALLCVGGAQAIAALAFGIGGPPNCDVIVGPGNRFVTAAKSIVSGHCAIDMLAGPSECLVLADETADAHLIAADLLAQAEHDTDALPILVTTSANLADRVDEEMGKQLAVLPTAAVASVSAAKGFTVLCSTLDEAISVVDKLAPEHLEVQVADSDFVWKRVKNYGGMFVGANTAEVFGDYGAGPNHVLPTSGTARYTGGLSVFTFLRVRTWLRSDAPVIDRAGLDAVARDSAHLARLEGLFGHEAAALARGSEEVKEEARLAKKN